MADKGSERNARRELTVTDLNPVAPRPASSPACRPGALPGSPGPDPGSGFMRLSFEARLARPRPEPEPGLSASPDQPARRAHRSLVSAACYLATRCTGDKVAVAEAVALLKRLSNEMAAGMLDSEDDPGHAALWTLQVTRWERQSLVEGAIRFARASSEARKVAIVPPRRSRWERWWNSWQGAPGMQSF